MFNFTEEIKNEIISSAVVTSILEEYYNLSLTVSGAKFDLMSGKDKLAFECADEAAEIILLKTGIVGEDDDGKYINFGICDGDKQFSNKADFIKGAFLGGGSCTLPEEEVFSRT